jgi:hypothetical protein
VFALDALPFANGNLGRERNEKIKTEAELTSELMSSIMIILTSRCINVFIHVSASQFFPRQSVALLPSVV